MKESQDYLINSIKMSDRPPPSVYQINTYSTQSRRAHNNLSFMFRVNRPYHTNYGLTALYSYAYCFSFISFVLPLLSLSLSISLAVSINLSFDSHDLGGMVFGFDLMCDVFLSAQFNRNIDSNVFDIMKQ